MAEGLTLYVASKSRERGETMSISPQEAYTLLATYKIKVVPSKFSVLTRY